MAWSIKEVAAFSGATSRMLRHYDKIGLLVPARLGVNGYRYYEERQLLRLQQIMLLRELGLGLEPIRTILDKSDDPLTVLNRHRRWLLAERDRFELLAGTVSDTIRRFEEGRMEPQYMFSGFDPDKLVRYRSELEPHLVEKYGDEAREHMGTSRIRTEEWTKEEHDEATRAWDSLNRRLAALVEAGVAVDSVETLDALDEHYRSVCRFWTPDSRSYAGLGQLYVDSDEFRSYYDGFHPELAEFLRDAMAAYARARLTQAPG